MDSLQGLIESFSPEEKKEAEDIETKIQAVTHTILSEKNSLDSNFVRLSQLIDEVRAKKYWLLGNYKTFGDYLTDCEKKYGIKHSQLYVGMKVARNLLPTVAEKDLVEIGITKAGVLSKYVEQSGNSQIPEDLFTLAMSDAKTEELDAAVNIKLNNVVQSEKGKWLALGGFYATEDEQAEMSDALQLAKSIDPIIPNNIPDWQQNKEAHLRLAREFIGSYS